MRLLSKTPSIDFIGKRKAAYVLSALLLLGSIGLYFAMGLNFGIDFKGGILIEIRTPEPGQIGEVRQKLSGLDLGNVELQEFGAPEELLIRIERQAGEEGAQIAAIDKVKNALGDGVEYRRTEYVGPKVGDELREAGIWAVSLALLAIAIYIWFRFEWPFAIAALAALLHDIIATIGIFALLQMEFNLSTLAALLTIAGYSINDTVVVFDRVRENLRRYKKMPIPELLNLSINETLARTLMTSLTTLAAVLALFFLGGEVIRGFSFALIWGILIGTYSSVFVAVPLLLSFDLRSGESETASVPQPEVDSK